MIASRKNEELTYEQITSFIDDLAEMKVRVLTLHGGEPLVYPDVFKVSKYAYSKGILVNFITNGLMLNEETIDEIIDAGINGITISLDGPEKIHDSVRGLKGTFQKITAGVAILKRKEKEGKKIPQIGISTYISALNQDFAAELFDEVVKLGIMNWGVGLVTYGSDKLSAATKKILEIKGDDAGQGNLDTLADDITGLDKVKMLKARETIKRENKSKKLQIIFPSEKAIINYDKPMFNEINSCLYPWTRVVVSPYGEVFPCVSLSMVNAVMGNIKDNSVREIWNNEKYKKLRNQMKKKGLLPICSKCCVINNVKLL